MNIIRVLLLLLVLFGFFTTLSRSLLKMAIGLALVSATLTVILFFMNSPLAAVFELSVCAGLITVVFVSVISLTQPASPREQEKGEVSHYSRFLPMVILVLLMAWAGQSVFSDNPVPVSHAAGVQDIRHTLWGLRRIDVFGQLAAMFAGIYGVIVLFKGMKNDK
jgi:NADH-quinone oxidoreductase subunit J